MVLGFPLPDFSFDDDNDYIQDSPSSYNDQQMEDFLESSEFQNFISLNKLKHISTKIYTNSVIYKVMTEDGKELALKTADVRNRIYEEYKNGKELEQSEFLVTPMALHECGKKFMIQMNSCECDISNFKFDEKSIWQLVHDIGSGLMVLHDNDYMHLDVSPGNILFSNGVFKLSDFGTLKKVGYFDEGDEGAGPYVSQEAISYPHNNYPVNSQTDIFSFGVVLFEIVTGKKAPRGGCDGYSMLRNGKIILGESKKWKTSVSEDLQKLINSMLKVDPNERPKPQELVLLSMKHCKKEL